MGGDQATEIGFKPVARTQGEFNGWACIGVGAFCVLLGAVFALDNAWFLRSAVAVNGKVVANREQAKKHPSHRSYYLPIVRFRDPQGNDHELEPNVASDTPLPLGTLVPVLYLAHRPERARVAGEFYWGATIGAFCIGALFVGFGAFLVFGSRWLVRLGVPMKPAGNVWPFRKATKA